MESVSIPMASGIIPEHGQSVALSYGESFSECKQLGREFAKFLHTNAASPFVDSMIRYLALLTTK